MPTNKDEKENYESKIESLQKRLEEGEKNLQTKIEDIEKRFGEVRSTRDLQEVQSAIGQPDSTMRILRTMVDDVLTQSPVYKLGRVVIPLFFAIGLALWVGGTIYGTFQIKSILAFREDAENQIGKILQEQSASIEKAIEKWETEINKEAGDFKLEKGKALQTLTKAVGDVQQEKKKTIQRLTSVDSSALKKEVQDLTDKITTLKAADGKLNIENITSFVSISLIGLCAFLFLTGAASILLSYIGWKRTRGITRT